MGSKTSQGGKKTGPFRSIFKRKKHSPPETRLETNVVVKETMSLGNPEPQTAAIIPPVATPRPTPVPIAESPPPLPEVAVVEEPSDVVKPSWFSRTHYFKSMSNWAFDVIDVDGSGCVDEKELYSGLLLIHLKLGSYAGPAACRPVAREQVHEIFIKRDLDNSGSLDREEFGEVMAVLCGNVFSRVFAQWSLTLIIVPMVAKIILDGIVWFAYFCTAAVSNLEDYDHIEGVVMTHYNQIVDLLHESTPEFLLTAGSTFLVRTQNVLDMIPDSVWSSVPLTLVSCVLGCLAVPYIIFKIDDFFQALADEKSKKNKASGK